MDAETVGQRIKRLRNERGLSLAKVGGADFTRAHLSQIELGQSQPSTRVLRVVAARLGTQVDYLLDGRLAALDTDLALERARIMVALGNGERALALLGQVSAEAWPLATDLALCRAAALRLLARDEEAAAILQRERLLIDSHGDSVRLRRLRAIQQGAPTAPAADPEAAAAAHAKLADRQFREGNSADALDNYRAARVLYEVIRSPTGK